MAQGAPETECPQAVKAQGVEREARDSAVKRYEETRTRGVSTHVRLGQEGYQLKV